MKSIPFFIGCAALNVGCTAVRVYEMSEKSQDSIQTQTTRIPRRRTVQRQRAVANKTQKWPQNPPLNQQQGGLTVRITNALHPSYHPYFYKAIRNWENATQAGSTNSVRFVVSTAPPPASENSWPNCDEGIYGEIIICNGDFGATNWVGIEMTVSKGEDMVKSKVKINDHYLNRQKVPPDYIQYTLCHEIGHSLGLPHDDEIYANAPLRSCLDYTMDVIDSQKPAKLDYDKLTRLYGKFSPPLSKAPTSSPVLKPVPVPVGSTSAPIPLVPLQSAPIPMFPTPTTSVPLPPVPMPNVALAPMASIPPPPPLPLPIPLAPSTGAPSLRPSTTPIHQPTTAPTESPTTAPTLSSCCSYNNKLCGMAPFCDANKITCEESCAGVWLNSQTRQDIQQSNCLGTYDLCVASAQCCGNSICELDVYRGYKICLPGPPTLSPTKGPTLSPSLPPTSRPTEVPVTVAPTSKPIPPQTTTYGIADATQQDQNAFDCFCPQTCTPEVLSSWYGSHTCKSHILYQMEVNSMSELYACALVSQVDPSCGDNCNPYLCPGSEVRRLGEAMQSSSFTKAKDVDGSAHKDDSTAFAQQPPTTLPRQLSSQKRRTLYQLDMGNLERDIGYDPDKWGQLIQMRSNALRYALPLSDGTTMVTDVSFLLVPEDFGLAV